MSLRTSLGRLTKLSMSHLTRATANLALALPVLCSSAAYSLTPNVNTAVARFTGVQSVTPTGFTSYGVTMDPAGDMFVADYGNNRIVETTVAGKQVVLPTLYGQPCYLALDKNNNLFVTTLNAPLVIEFPFSGGGYGPAQIVYTYLSKPWGIAVDSTNHIVVNDHGTGAVVRLSLYGSFYLGNTIVSPGVLSLPAGMAFDAQNNLYIADRGNNRIAVYTGGRLTFPFTTIASPGGLAVNAAGSIAVTTPNGLYSGAVGHKAFTLLASNFTVPNGVTFGPDGSVYVDDTNAEQIVRQIPITGAVDYGSVRSFDTLVVKTLVFVFDQNATLWPTYNPFQVTGSSQSLARNWYQMVDSSCSIGSTMYAGQTCTADVGFYPMTSFYGGEDTWGTVTLLSSDGAGLAAEPVKGHADPGSPCHSNCGGGKQF